MCGALVLVTSLQHPSKASESSQPPVTYACFLNQIYLQLQYISYWALDIHEWDKEKYDWTVLCSDT